MKMSIAAETSPLLGTTVFVFSFPIQQAKNLQRSRSNHGPRLSPTISSGKITVLQRQDWLEASCWVSIKREEKPRTRRRKSTQKKSQEQGGKVEKTEHKFKYRQKERTRGQHTMTRIILEIVLVPVNKQKTRI